MYSPNTMDKNTGRNGINAKTHLGVERRQFAEEHISLLRQHILEHFGSGLLLMRIGNLGQTATAQRYRFRCQ